jgi:hypothetical protein
MSEVDMTAPADPIPEKQGLVEAVGVASISDTPGLSKVVEAAMSQAVLDCYAEGIIDPKIHRERMMQYRAKAKAEFYAAQAAPKEAIAEETAPESDATQG